MSTNEPTLDDSSTLGWTALLISGAFLLAFALGFMRFLAGSWRETAALSLASLGYFAGLLLLARVVATRSVAHWRRLAAVLPLLGAGVGAAYVAASAATGVRPVVTGLTLGAVHGVLIAWQAGRRPSRRSAPAP
jgi:hypothetical protein